MQVRDGTPKVSLVAETATMRVKWRVWQEKLLLVKRLQKQKPSSLSRVLYEEQVKLGWPGLAAETTSICAKLGLKDINYFKVKKKEIKNAIFCNQYKDLKEKMKNSRKL